MSDIHNRGKKSCDIYQIIILFESVINENYICQQNSISNFLKDFLFFITSIVNISHGTRFESCKSSFT